MIPLPDYINLPTDSAGVCEIDPDKFYPKILSDIQSLGEFSIEVQRSPKGPTETVTLKYDGTLDQYWLEVAFNMMKMETVFWCKLASVGPIRERRVVGTSADYKERWGQVGKPLGRIADLEREFGPRSAVSPGAVSKVDAQVRREAREIYKKLRGVVPDMAM